MALIPIQFKYNKSDRQSMNSIPSDAGSLYFCHDGTIFLDPPDGSTRIAVGGAGNVIQIQADWNQEDSTQVDFIKNKPFYNLPTQNQYMTQAISYNEDTGELFSSSQFSRLVLKDVSTGELYFVFVTNGQLECAKIVPERLEIISFPTTLEYAEGEYGSYEGEFDWSGLQVFLYDTAGNSINVTDECIWSGPNIIETETSKQYEYQLKYSISSNNVIVGNYPIVFTVRKFDVNSLVDFEYESKAITDPITNNTTIYYTLTKWLGTTQGLNSGTECIVPNNRLITVNLEEGLL